MIMKRPYIICQIMQSVDGRVAWDMVDKIRGEEYYDALGSLDCPFHVGGKTFISDQLLRFLRV